MGGFSSPNSGLGIRQYWMNFSGMRSRGTSYQNTTGKPLMVAVSASSGGMAALSVSEDNSTFLLVSKSYSAVAGEFMFACIVVPPKHFYREDGSGSFYWTELR